MAWGSISLFAGFLEKENSLETLIVIFENVSPKGFFWLNMKNFEISVLTANSRYLQTAALKKIFDESQVWKFRNYKDWYGKPCKRDWMAKVVFVIQTLLTFGGRCNRYLWDIRLKILRLPNFNMPSSLC